MLSLFYKMKINSFALSLLILLFFFINPNVSYAKDSLDLAPAKYIDYDLAFPGILPDNPLYKLKVLRDKISVFLISDHYKKIDFYLLQADKGILATAMLIDKNKIKLAEKTALKAEHNMTLVTYELKQLWKKPSNELFEKLKTASLKHQEVLNALIIRVPSQNRETLIRVLDFSKTNLQTVGKLQSKKYYVQQ